MKALARQHPKPTSEKHPAGGNDTSVTAPRPEDGRSDREVKHPTVLPDTSHATEGGEQHIAAGKGDMIAGRATPPPGRATPPPGRATPPIPGKGS